MTKGGRGETRRAPSNQMSTKRDNDLSCDVGSTSNDGLQQISKLLRDVEITPRVDLQRRKTLIRDSMLRLTLRPKVHQNVRPTSSDGPQRPKAQRSDGRSTRRAALRERCCSCSRHNSTTRKHMDQLVMWVSNYYGRACPCAMVPPTSLAQGDDSSFLCKQLGQLRKMSNIEHFCSAEAGPCENVRPTSCVRGEGKEDAEGRRGLESRTTVQEVDVLNTRIEKLGL